MVQEGRGNSHSSSLELFPKRSSIRKLNYIPSVLPVLPHPRALLLFLLYLNAQLAFKFYIYFFFPVCVANVSDMNLDWDICPLSHPAHPFVRLVHSPNYRSDVVFFFLFFFSYAYVLQTSTVSQSATLSKPVALIDFWPCCPTFISIDNSCPQLPPPQATWPMFQVQSTLSMDMHLSLLLPIVTKKKWPDLPMLLVVIALTMYIKSRRYLHSVFNEKKKKPPSKIPCLALSHSASHSPPPFFFSFILSSTTRYK